MAGIAFDANSADALIAAARRAGDVLRDEASARGGAAEVASTDFEGGYAMLFRIVCSVEADDRGRLAGVLDDLARQVSEAKRKAEEEQDRVRELAAWKVREAERDERRRNEALLGTVTADVDGFFDRKPSEFRVVPPVISAAFAAKNRIRTAGGTVSASGSGKSSADTGALRTYVGRSRASNTRMEAELGRVGNAWAAFTASCSWVPVESASFLRGFERLLGENAADVVWIEQVAAAFDAAGGGSLSNQALNLAAAALTPMSDQALLDALASLSAAELAALLTASPGLQAQLQVIDPVIVSAWWQGLNPAAPTQEEPFSGRQRLLLNTFPVLFGNLEGVPYGARSVANQLALTAAIADMRARLDGLTAGAGEAPPQYGAVGDATLALQQRYQTQLAALLNIQASLQSPNGGDRRFLIALTQDEPPLAAVSIGDLDTATSVTYAVPGMDTATTAMTGWAKSAQNLSWLLPPGGAVVAWIGYQAPRSTKLDVLDLGRAAAGADNLTATLRGLSAVRGESMPRLNIVAHSYGTTTAALALARPGGVTVDTFITLGSAGLPDTVRSVADLNVERMYSGQADGAVPFVPFQQGDEWAWVGRERSVDHQVDPMRNGFGSHAFGVDTGGAAGRAVTEHGALVGDSGDDAGYLDWRTESLGNTARAISGETDRITAYGP